MAIKISKKNVKEHSWIWDFLENQRATQGIFTWQTQKEFSYNGHKFKFAEKIVARKRKNEERGYAYEMISAKPLGNGMYGTVYNVSCTLSNGKNKAYQAEDKKRVVKIQTLENTQKEYDITQDIEHLHVKEPVTGHMFMDRMNGQSLSNFLFQNTISLQQRVELTRALLAAYKTQVLDLNIMHRDMHLFNVMIQYHPEQTKDKFEIKIIDYGRANKIKKEHNRWAFVDLYHIIRDLWKDVPGTPYDIKIIVNQPIKAARYVNFFELFDKVLLAPTIKHQDIINDAYTFLNGLQNTHKELAIELKNKIHTAVKQSTPNNFYPLNQAFWEYKQILADKNIKHNQKFIFVFDSDNKKQKAFEDIFSYFTTLEIKGNTLQEKGYAQEGKELCTMVKELREKTFTATHIQPAERIKALNECQQSCKELLAKNQKLLNIRRNNNYIWAEIGIVLSSLIILYPIVAGINYAFTGRIGLFSQTASAAGAKDLANNFTKAIPNIAK
jgi:hypothetical protein